MGHVSFAVSCDDGMKSSRCFGDGVGGFIKGSIWEGFARRRPRSIVYGGGLTIARRYLEHRLVSKGR